MLLAGISTVIIGLILLVISFLSMVPLPFSDIGRESEYAINETGSLIIDDGVVKLNDTELPGIHTSSLDIDIKVTDWTVLALGLLLLFGGVILMSSAVDPSIRARNKFIDELVQKWIDSGDLPAKDEI